MNLKDDPNIIWASSTSKFGHMSYSRADANQVTANRKAFLKSLGLKLEQIVYPMVVHGTNIKVLKEDNPVTNGYQGWVGEYDSVMTDRKGQFLFLVTGDCIPLGLYDPINKAICLLHASRANIRKIISKSIKKMEQEYGTKASDLIAEIGPSIGYCCYTWHPGENIKVDKLWKKYINKNSEDTYTLDLWTYAKDKLKLLGVKEDNISKQIKCSYHNIDYYSHREYEEKKLQHDSRFATVLGIK